MGKRTSKKRKPKEGDKVYLSTADDPMEMELREIFIRENGDKMGRCKWPTYKYVGEELVETWHDDTFLYDLLKLGPPPMKTQIFPVQGF